MAIALLAWTAGFSGDRVQQHYPSSYAGIVDGAKQEKQLIVYNTVHADAALNEILSRFRKLYPFITVKDSDGDALRTYNRFLREHAQGQGGADFLWTLGMDLQEKLINDGFAQPYTSPEIAFLPSWAHWQDLGYGVTQEPIAFVYNSRFLSAGEMPHTHAELRDLLLRKPQRLRGRVASYDPAQSEVGMLLMSQDIQVTPDSWALFDSLGQVDSRVYSTSRDMLASILRGDQWIGYDVIASYAIEMQKKHPELVVVYPSDYVLVMSRVAFIAGGAAHPNAARLFLDFLLSREGQQTLKSHGMGSVRADIGVPREQSRIDPIRTRAIRIGPGLLADLDSLVRAQFLRRWQQARGAQDRIARRP